jgi:3-dehydroquinate synthase
MRILRIHGTTGFSNLLVGEPLQNLQRHLPDERVVIVTDSNVRNYYLNDFPRAQIIEIGAGEGIKNLDTVLVIYRKLMAFATDRSTFVVGIGGGIVCDIAGFVASTYLRGLRFGFVPTTLLSQVDAGVGGKNGINLDGFKNLVGVFNQPEFVLCDTGFLRTLPEAEVSAGLAEIVKHAAIADPAMFSYLEKKPQNALRLDRDVIEKLIYDSLLVKSGIVNRDEKESGERRKLNFGHTFGHAFEKVLGMSHGRAVSLGMVLAAALSVRKGYLSAEEAERLESLLGNLKLPLRVKIDGKAVLDALRQDKKRNLDSIYFVLLRGLGNAVVEEITIRDLKSFLKEHL